MACVAPELLTLLIAERLARERLHRLRGYPDDVLEAAESLLREATQAVADYRPSLEAQRRIAELITQEKEGSLSVEQKSELDHFMDLEHILRVAKARARQILASGS